MPQEGAVICIVDDDAAVRSALKFALELEGLNVRLYDGAQAMLGDSELPPNGCLVVDYRMPEMDGLQLVDALRARDVRFPAIMITGRANKDLRRLAERSGVSDVLEKPLSDSALVDSIRTVLGAVG
ncbi:Response regulator receiver domain-containing protein [Enhydrobacter aerosaccus]|uniref:Response regulator receiver domain-containing protein n=1 Tax=Enhydrobacter aerosaccus TaxID=225324 RepID=A0A1T4R1C5_9HYPH|nr:response regulator [Enhydrobacter aerosaccus]SKA09687.1 Response regulator receiver domain-containing protein [Enhydrobacter aerosaccus]